MKCIYCKSNKALVIESRENENGVIRIRHCSRCRKRFYTLEAVTRKDSRIYEPQKRKLQRPFNYYTVYDLKTDEIIASGNAQECAEQLGVTLNTMYKTVMLSKRGKSKKYYVLVDDNTEDLI